MKRLIAATLLVALAGALSAAQAHTIDVAHAGRRPTDIGVDDNVGFRPHIGDGVEIDRT